MIPGTLISNAVAPAVAQTMLHFVWQGFTLWVLALCVLHALRATAPQIRYATFCVLLVLLAICPLVTFGIVFHRPTPGPSIGRPAETLPAPDLSTALSRPPAHGPPVWTSATTALVARLERGQGWLVAIWFGGVILFATRLALAAAGVARIKSRRRTLSPDCACVVDRIARRLAFRRRPAVYVVDDLPQAIAVGLFKPLVLLPASWLCKLPPEVMEIVIAHELAHLRRWDLAVNLFQRVVECVLFYHPVVWWCSKRMRIEREMCCDALAVGVVGNRAQYAKALTYLADQRMASTQPLLVAGIGGPRMVLLERIRQVLGLATQKRGPFYGTTCAAAGAVAASIVWLTGVAVFYASSRSAAIDDETTAAVRLAVPEPRLPAESGNGLVANEGMTGRIRFGAATEGIEVPSEQNKISLPSYTIEPPDILFIEAIRVVPKPPYHIQAADVLRIQVAGGLPTSPQGGGSKGDEYLVDPAGRIDLGPLYGGKVKVAGLTQDEATDAIQQALAKYLKDPHVSVQMLQSAALQPITGEHLVAPDGRVSLGIYGQIYVAGMTLEEAKTAIDAQLGKHLDIPNASVSVFAYNSKVYYVVTEGASGDTVARFPITGNETVLDALSLMPGLRSLSTKRIWIARPMPGGSATDVVLPVNWEEISSGAYRGQNYQVFPGDRIFIAEKSGLAKVAAPTETRATRPAH
jgi:polysaccharide biosynthesis/export protein